jgi:polyisoprenoid-binding protein YceI
MPLKPFLLLAFVPCVLAAQLPQRFEIDTPHSSIGFAVRFMGMSTVRGAFASYGGTVMYRPDDVEKSSVSAIIETSSINTNEPERDQHLKSPDFFDVARFPYITFRSTAIRKSKDGFIADGDFRMHGVAKRLAIPFRMLNPPMSDAWGNSRMTLEGSIKLSRKEYGILGTAFWNSEFDPGRMSVSDEVQIDLLISATIPNVLTWGDRQGDSLLADIEARGVNAAVASYRSARLTNPKVDSIGGFAFSMAGEKLVAKKRIPDAIALLEAVTETRPRAIRMKAQLGEAYVKLGQLDKARSIFELVAAADSTNTRAAEWLRVLARKGP